MVDPFPRLVGAFGALATARLSLLPIVAEHAPVLFGVLAEPALYAVTGGAPPASVEALQARFAHWERRRSADGSELWFNWLVREQTGGVAIGYVQTTVRNPSVANVAWVIGGPWQRLGYATEAASAVVRWLEGLGVTHLRACIAPAHTASQRVAERVGLGLTREWEDGEQVWTRAAAERGDAAPSR